MSTEDYDSVVACDKKKAQGMAWLEPSVSPLCLVPTLFSVCVPDLGMLWINRGRSRGEVFVLSSQTSPSFWKDVPKSVASEALSVLTLVDEQYFLRHTLKNNNLFSKLLSLHSENLKNFFEGQEV